MVFKLITVVSDSTLECAKIINLLLIFKNIHHFNTNTAFLSTNNEI